MARAMGPSWFEPSLVQSQAATVSVAGEMERPWPPTPNLTKSEVVVDGAARVHPPWVMRTDGG